MYVVVAMIVFSSCCQLDFFGGLSEIGLSFGSIFGPFFRVDHFFDLVDYYIFSFMFSPMRQGLNK